MVLGAPASGKSSYSETLEKKGYIHLNRDKEGGSVIDLLPKMEILISNGKSIVLDNLFSTAESRKPFISAAKINNVPIRCIWVTTSIEDSMINALHRMWNRYQKIFFHPSDLKGVKDPNMFPIAVFFKHKKEFEKPSTSEGFDRVDSEKFTRIYNTSYTNKAAIFDYDGTLRVVKNGEFEFPVKPSEVELLSNRIEKLVELKKQGYILLGASNQSGVAKGDLTLDDAKACFEQTNKLLKQDIDCVFCPHSVPPVCYCRKPQSGIAVYLMNKYKLDPRKCIYVGDQTTDKTFAARVGFQYFDAGEFFRK